MAHIEVDQSGRIGDTSVATVLAFSNEISFSVLIPAAVKREYVEFLRSYYRHLRQPYMKLFAAGLFLLLKDHLCSIESVTIDREYTGLEGIIKGMLLNHLRKLDPEFPKEGIAFRHIGKKSRAHQKAYDTFRGRVRPDRVITTGELVACLSK